MTEKRKLALNETSEPSAWQHKREPEILKATRPSPEEYENFKRLYAELLGRRQLDEEKDALLLEIYKVFHDFIQKADYGEIIIDENSSKSSHALLERMKVVIDRL